MKRAERLNQELIFLSSKKSFNLSDLMKEFNISKRTALRDIQDLEFMGLPFYVENGRNGGYKLINEKLIIPIYFDIEEITSIFFALKSLELLSTTPFEKSYPLLYKKLLATLPDEQKEKILNSESLIKKEEEKIKNAREILQINSRYKSILYTQGEKLVDVVKDIISEMLDIDLSGFIDKKKEDIRFEYNNDVFIGEIKGIADNVKSKNLSQLDNHFTAFVDENPNIDEEKIFKLLIINSQRELPLDKRDSIDNKQIAQAEKKYKSLIIETKTLLKLFEDYKNQKINREEIIEKLKTYGILKL